MRNIYYDYNSCGEYDWNERFGSDYTLCGCHQTPTVSPGQPEDNSIGRQLEKLVGVMKLKLSTSSSAEDRGGEEKGRGGVQFDTLKMFGKLAMLRPPPPPSTSLKKKKHNDSNSGKVKHPHPDVLVGSRPSNHDAVHFTPPKWGTYDTREKKVLSLYQFWAERSGQCAVGEFFVSCSDCFLRMGMGMRRGRKRGLRWVEMETI